MNTPTTEHLLTGDDLLELQARTGKPFELVKGIPIETPFHFAYCGLIIGKICGSIYEFVRNNKLGFVLMNTGFYLSHHPDTVRGADVAFISNAKLGRVADIPERGFLNIVPDLVVEARSPSDTNKEVDEKVGDWQKAGASIIWVIDSQKKQAEVYQLGRPKQTLSETDALAGVDVLNGFSLSLKDIF